MSDNNLDFLGAAGNLISSVGGAFFENTLGRQNEERQWNKYYSPKAQVENLAAAGINPAVAMGNQSPVLSAGGQMQMPNVSPFGIGTTALSEIGNYLNAKANAKKANVETEGTELDNAVKRITQNERIKEIALQNKWTAEQTAKITQEVGLMSAQFQEIQQRIENMRSEKKFTDKQVDWYDRHMTAEINHLKSSAEYQHAVAGLTDSQKQLLDDTMDDLKSITNLNKQQMEKIVGLLDKYGDAQAIVGMLSQIVGSASDLIGSIASFKNINKTVETITGSTTQKSDGSWTTTNTRTTKK